MQKFNEAQVEAQLQARPEWSESGGSIQRTFAFRTFAEAMKFVTRVAEAAEAANHHPDILIRYNKVTLNLSTHDAGGITQKDFDLAAKIDALAPPPPPPSAPPPATGPAPAPAAASSRPPSGAAAAGGSKRGRKGS
jgi:4a-hydroxytetrahydrobiopterin dehydratase